MGLHSLREDTARIGTWVGDLVSLHQDGLEQARKHRETAAADHLDVLGAIEEVHGKLEALGGLVGLLGEVKTLVGDLQAGVAGLAQALESFTSDDPAGKAKVEEVAAEVELKLAGARSFLDELGGAANRVTQAAEAAANTPALAVSAAPQYAYAPGQVNPHD